MVHGFRHRDARRPTVEDDSSGRILEFVHKKVHDCTIVWVVSGRVNRRGEAAGSLLRPVDKMTIAVAGDDHHQRTEALFGQHRP